MEQKLIIESTIKTAQRINGRDSGIAVVSQGIESRTADTMIRLTPAVAAGLAGAVSAAGVDGLPDGHGIEAADVVGLSWDGGMRYGITVDTANANDIAFDDTPPAAGDALPAEDTAVMVALEVPVELGADGDQVKGLVVVCDHDCQLRFEEADGTVILALDLTAGVPYVWLADSTVPNPLTGNPWAKLVAVNKEDVAAVLQITVLYDA